MDFTEKRLTCSVLMLAALPVAQRAAETAQATKVLGELDVRSNNPARASYAKALLEIINAGVVEPLPWLAFTSRGPGKPPPAIELLRPDPRDEDSGWWATFKAWTGPGQMYALIVDGEMPGNELTEATKAVTLGVASAAVAGVEAVGAVAALPIGKIVVGGFVLGGAVYYFKRKKVS